MKDQIINLAKNMAKFLKPTVVREVHYYMNNKEVKAFDTQTQKTFDAGMKTLDTAMKGLDETMKSLENMFK